MHSQLDFTTLQEYYNLVFCPIQNCTVLTCRRPTYYCQLIENPPLSPVLLFQFLHLCVGLSFS